MVIAHPGEYRLGVAAEFVHLHVHTQYSFLVSTVRVKDLAAGAKERGMHAVAITDSANMFGALRHYKECRAKGLTPLLGAELNVAREDGSKVSDHLVVLAATNEGYKNLVELVSVGHIQPAVEGIPSVRWNQIAERSKGLVGLSGCLGGVIAQQVLENGESAGVEQLGRVKELFEPGHFFVELQDHGLPEQSVINEILERGAKSVELPVVATNDVHFLGKDDGEAQFILECIRKNRIVADARPHHHNRFEMYLKSPDEMAALFGAGSPALSNTLRIAEMCKDLKLTLNQPMLPRFPIPEGYSVDSYFRSVAEAGLTARFEELAARSSKVDHDVYRKRLEWEVETIISMQYPGYFLIVWDFIREAKSRGIPVGPGRGSGAGSLVAFAMGITSIDPLPYDLLFERFLNPERVSMPDFDVDFCMDRRDEVIRYVSEKYGQSSVGQIATYQNLKARSVIKDVARTMAILPTEAQRIASLVPELGQGKMCTIDQALEIEPKLKTLVDSDERVAELIRQASKLEGLTRHAGMHAAGVVISDGPLYEHVPVFSSDGNFVTQYDKDDVESAGLVKFDFLGLKTLTVIDIAERLVRARPDQQGKDFDVDALPLDDSATYQLIASGETTGVFQLESSGMQQLLRQLKPDHFEDIVAAVALYRPGPLGTGMIDDYISGKHGRKPIRKLHPLVDPVLAPTYGVPVYQEQVMQIAQRLAGFTLGGADLLRRAMGKKKAEEMQKQLEIFVQGAIKNGVDEEQARAIFREIEGFASYGFNKSHSAAYALVTYQTAYLKAHFPVEFFAALMTADKDKIEKVVRTIAEARAWGVNVLSPDVNASDIDFTVVYSPRTNSFSGRLRDPYEPKIRFGLGAIRGLGTAALEAVLEARKAGGDFRDLFDFASRVDAKRLNRGVLEALVQSGGFDVSLQRRSISRARAMAAVEIALERSRQATRDRERGQATLFGLFAAAAPPNAKNADSEEYPEVEEWDRIELLRREKQALGCYVSGHPLHRYGGKIARLGTVEAANLGSSEPWSVASLAGIVEGYQEKVFKSGGGKMALFELEDMSGRVKAKVRGDRVETYGALLNAGEPVLIKGKVSFPVSDNESEEEQLPTLLVDEVVPLSAAVLGATRSLRIRLDARQHGSQRFPQLKRLFEAHTGPCPVDMVVSLPGGAEAQLVLDGIRVEASDAVLSGLERLFGGYVAELR